MLRCVRLWTGQDGNSHFEEGQIDLPRGERGDVLSGNVPVVSISFRETNPGGTISWHDAPARQLVLTLSGTLEFETRDGSRFTISPGEILLAEDMKGSGLATCRCFPVAEGLCHSAAGRGGPVRPRRRRSISGETSMSDQAFPDDVDAVLIGAGIMSATLATVLRELAGDGTCARHRL